MATHRDLDAWKKSIDFVVKIYKITENFPKEEIYGITSQIRRAAVSISSNIAEGAGRNSDKEFMHFLSISIGSLAEVDTQLIICRELKFISVKTYEELEIEIINVRKLILGLKRYLYGKQR